MITVNSIIKCRNDDTMYRVIESNDDRLIISPVTWDYEIVPQETIHISDVEHVFTSSTGHLTGKDNKNEHA